MNKAIKYIGLTLFIAGVGYVSYRLLKPMLKSNKAKKNCEDLNGTWDGTLCKKADGTVIDPVVSPEDEHKGYVAESFPLKKGMYGIYTESARGVFGLSTTTDVFDTELEDALYKKFKVKEITQAQYDYYKKYFGN